MELQEDKNEKKQRDAKQRDVPKPVDQASAFGMLRTGGGEHHKMAAVMAGPITKQMPFLMKGDIEEPPGRFQTKGSLMIGRAEGGPAPAETEVMPPGLF